jgi:hypothetical protein
VFSTVFSGLSPWHRGFRRGFPVLDGRFCKGQLFHLVWARALMKIHHPAGASQPTRGSGGRRNIELMRLPRFRQAFEDSRRLKIVADFQEYDQGLLRVDVGPSFDAGTSVEYNLGLLWRAYRETVYYDRRSFIVLWPGGAIIGEYGPEGYLLHEAQ